MKKKVKVYSLKAEEVGQVEVDPSLAPQVVPQLVKDAVEAVRYNQRQWSAHTLTRTEVNRTGRKMYRQKGTGRARHGSLAAPIFVGGGVAHGPRDRGDPFCKVNRREKQAVGRFLIAGLVSEDRVCGLKFDAKSLDKPKSKVLAEFMQKTKLSGHVYFLMEEVHGDEDNLCKDLLLSLRNLPSVQIKCSTALSAYDLVKADHLVCVNGALEDLTRKMEGVSAT